MAKKSSASLVNTSLGIRLSTHEKLCAERMKHIQESIKELSKEVKSLRTEVSKGKGAVAVLVFIGTLVVSVLGFLNYKWNMY